MDLGFVVVAPSAGTGSIINGAHELKGPFHPFCTSFKKKQTNCNFKAEIELQRHLLAKAVFVSENKSWRSLQKSYCHISV